MTKSFEVDELTAAAAFGGAGVREAPVVKSRRASTIAEGYLRF
ncbi:MULTISPECIES: hypothetical protein [Kribbella]|nr:MULTISPECIES: hypothetical protein [Kribbella]